VTHSQEIREARRLKVGVLLSGRETFGPFYGGALARWTYEVYRRLTDQLDVEVFGFPPRRQDFYAMPYQSSRFTGICRIMTAIPVIRRNEDRFWLWTLRERWRQAEVLHVHSRPQWVGVLRDLGYRGKLVLHLHNDHLGHWTGKMLDGLAPKLDAVVTCSSYLRERFAAGSPALASKARVVFNGVNTQVFCPSTGMRETKTIFFVGRFDPEKGVRELVKAYALILEFHPDAVLVIAGTTGFGTHKETAYVQEVRQLAELIERRGGNIKFIGYADHDTQLPSWFQKATIFVCPSLFQEPFGLVNVEAMACATPVVGARRGGIPEVLGDTGMLVDPENTKEFADALSLLLSDAGLRNRMGEAGYERCRIMFDWDVVASHWNALLQSVGRDSNATCIS